jgi:hypothetical protein
MLELHGKLHKDIVSGVFIYPTMHCPSTPGMWQVGVDFSDPSAPIGAEPKGRRRNVRKRTAKRTMNHTRCSRPSEERRGCECAGRRHLIW